MNVVDAVEIALQARGFKPEGKVADVRFHGPDLIMKSPRGVLFTVEAKGQRSSQPHTRRYPDEFTPGQKEDHLGRALVRSLRLLSEGAAAGIALPGDPVDARLIQERARAFSRIGLVVLLVSPEDRSMKVAVGELPK